MVCTRSPKPRTDRVQFSGGVQKRLAERLKATPVQGVSHWDHGFESHTAINGSGPNGRGASLEN